MIISQKKLKEIINYDKKTGKITLLKQVGCSIKSLEDGYIIINGNLYTVDTVIAKYVFDKKIPDNYKFKRKNGILTDNRLFNLEIEQDL